MAMNERTTTAARPARGSSWWVENLLRPVLIAVMMACLAAPLVRILEWIMPGWQGTYFLVFCFLAGLEGILSERSLRKRRITGWAYLGSRAAEALILLIILKLANYLPLGLDQLLADAALWPLKPDSIITILDILTGVVFLALWAGSLNVGRLVTELDVEDAKVSPPQDKTSTEYYLWLTEPPVVRDRQERLDALIDVFMWGGILLLIAVGLSHLMLPDAPPPALAVLLYFALGIALLTQAHFSVVRAGWRVQNIPVQRGIGRRWLAWDMLFLLGIALVALLLPTWYTLGPLQALLAVIGLVAQGFFFVVTFVYLLFVLLMSLLFPGFQMPEGPATPVPPAPIVEPTPVGGTSQPWLEILASISFWGLILIIVGYTLLRVWRDRFSGLEGDGTVRLWWDRILDWMRALWQRWRAQGLDVPGWLARRRAALRAQAPTVPRPLRFFFPGRLPPRELIRYYFLSTTRRAAQAGQSRETGQTPYEYQASLDQRYPELEPDLEGLTDAFVLARYSAEPLGKEDATAVKPLWQRIKDALRRRRLPGNR
jgi:hypothetical protein